MHDGPLWARNHKPPGSVCPAHLSGSYTLLSYFSPLRPGSGNQVSSSTTCSQIHPSLLIPRPRPRPIRRPRPRPRPQSHLHRIVLALAHALAHTLRLHLHLHAALHCTALHLECLRSCLLVGCSWPLPPWIRSSPLSHPSLYIRLVPSHSSRLRQRHNFRPSVQTPGSTPLVFWNPHFWNPQSSPTETSILDSVPSATPTTQQDSRRHLLLLLPWSSPPPNAHSQSSHQHHHPLRITSFWI